MCVCVCVVRVCVHVCVSVYVCGCLATKVFIGNLPAIGWWWVTNQLHDINWGARCVCVCTCVHAYERGRKVNMLHMHPHLWYIFAPSGRGSVIRRLNGATESSRCM